MLLMKGPDAPWLTSFASPLANGRMSRPYG